MHTYLSVSKEESGNRVSQEGYKQVLVSLRPLRKTRLIVSTGSVSTNSGQERIPAAGAAEGRLYFIVHISTILDTVLDTVLDCNTAENRRKNRTSSGGGDRGFPK